MELPQIISDNIVAVSTPHGEGGIAVIRLSGPDAFAIADKAWKGASIAEAKSHTAHLGMIVDTDGESLDQAVATVYRAPASFTGENVVELSCHGSRWIQREVVNLLIRLGARTAEPGEFSQRAFLNGKLDLAQAEGIADLIAARSRAAHKLAMSQLKGDFSSRLESLRSQLVDLASLLELELDFSEEDVEFADRSRLIGLADEILGVVDRLADSYSSGSAFKEGVPVVIAGQPNAGKSTLLNRLLKEDKAIVSDIPGTTRDIIEDTIELNGIMFRFIDTAGLHATDDKVENIGIDRALQRIEKAAIVLWIIDSTHDIQSQLRDTAAHTLFSGQKALFLLNKSDLSPADSFSNHYEIDTINGDIETIKISATTGEGIEALEKRLTEIATETHNPDNEIIVTNARHYEALIKGSESLKRAKQAIEQNTSADLIAQDIREALHHLGTITGAITTETLLHSIFTRFCIGK